MILYSNLYSDTDYQILKPDGKQSYKIVHCEVNWIMECLDELEKRNKFVSLSGIIKFDIQRMLHGCKKEKRRR